MIGLWLWRSMTIKSIQKGRETAFLVGILSLLFAPALVCPEPFIDGTARFRCHSTSLG